MLFAPVPSPDVQVRAASEEKACTFPADTVERPQSRPI